MNVFRLRACALLGLALSPLHAEAPEVVLSGPEIQKLDWNTRMLQVADVNCDGLLDIVVANNDRATVDILYQLKPGEAREAAKSARTSRWEPVVEDARVRRERVTTGVTMYDLVVGDLNNDGRPDLVYTGDPQALTVRYQREDGSWNEVRVTEAPAPVQSPVSLRIADLNGDGRADLVMLGGKELAIFSQTETGELAAPRRFPLADENCYGLELVDVDGDGRLDITYLSNARRDALRVRLQNSNGQFGPEQAYAIKEARSTLQVLAKADAKKKAPARFVFAQTRTGQLEFFNFESASGKSASAPAPRPRVFTPRATSKTPAAYAVADFNGDGWSDVAVSDPDGAQVYVYFRQPDGGFTVAERYPSFADVRSLAAVDWDRDGKTELVVASLKEQAAGLATINADGRLDYPKPLPGTGRPLAVAAGILGKGQPPALIVLREEKSKRWFDVITRGEQGEPTVARSVQLPGLKTDPRGVQLVDANQDGLLDVAVFTPLDALRIFIQGNDGSFTDAAVASAGFRKGLVDNLDPSALGSGTLDVGRGDAEVLLVSTGAFARALRINRVGELEVVDQFNARDTNAEIAASFVLPAVDGKRPDVLLYDRKGEQFQRLKANKQGVYESAESWPVGRIDVVGSLLSRGAKNAKSTELFLFGKDRFWWVPMHRGDFTVHSVETYTTDLPDISYADVIAGDLTGDGKPELVAIDPDNNLVEILAYDAEAKAWVSRLHFKVFEIDQHFQGRKSESLEPREAIIADVTGDGRKDLVLLVHDRVLIYPQK